MKKAVAAVISIAIMLCCCVTAFAEAKYEYTAPLWLGSKETDGNTTKWVSPDFTSFLLLTVEANEDNMNISELTEDDIPNLISSFSDKKYKNPTLELTDFEGYECIYLECEMDVDKKFVEDFGKTYDCFVYIFASVDNIYMFLYTPTKLSSKSALDFEESFKTFKINEPLPPGSKNNGDPDLTLAIESNKSVNNSEEHYNTIKTVSPNESDSEDGENFSFLDSGIGKITVISGVILIVCLIGIMLALYIRNQKSNNDDDTDDEPIQNQTPPAPPQNSYPQYQQQPVNRYPQQQQPPVNRYPQQQPPVSRYSQQIPKPPKDPAKQEQERNKFWGDTD